MTIGNINIDNIEHRKISNSISLSGEMWNETDKHVREDGFGSRSQFIETLLKRYMYERNNSDRKHEEMFSDKQMGTYFGDLDRHTKVSSIDERRRILPFVEHSYKLAWGLSRTLKRDISKITEHDPLEKIRLEGLRKAKAYRDAHEVVPEAAATEIKVTPEYMAKFSAKLAKLRSETQTDNKTNTTTTDSNSNSNPEMVEIELKKLVEDAAKVNRRKLRTETNTETNTNIKIIEDEIPNPYPDGEGETVFQ
jgi:Arc/MetJ-type ribon-helix-helix transcriptional regulator